MISADYCRLFAAYNHWQNTSLIAAADGLSAAERWRDMGAYFKSVAATFNHLYWADALMLARLGGNERPQDTIRHDLKNPSAWSDFKALRAARDREVTAWADQLAKTDLKGTVAWYPPDGAARIEMPRSHCAVQMFNHQTHHRGQIHAMLTALGAKPDATDIALMPQ